MSRTSVQRRQTKSGKIVQKSGDTHLKSIEKTYGVKFNRRSDMHLSNLLKEEGITSLSKLLEKNGR